MRKLTIFAVTFLFYSLPIGHAWCKLTTEQLQQLPPLAAHEINFAAEIKPIFEASCIKCHGRGRDKGGLRLDTRETILKGGDTGPAILAGNSADSLLIELVQGFDPDAAMPQKGTRLTPDQVGLLRAWIDQGAKWDAGITFGRLEPNNLKPRQPEIPPGPKNANPIDLLLQPYFTAHQIKPAGVVDDHLFARRVYLDVVGLLPSPKQLDTFVADKHSDKRQRLVRTLLTDNFNYAQHWMTFWNDALRNDYRGTGYIDGGRRQITSWLYAALATNMPYDQFVSWLISPTPETEGFTKGIVWRGAVNASQTPEMQTAQNISQVFMGVNLKCASCHDSFINDLTLADAYGLAGIYADSALEMVHCDKPTGKKAELRFIYPELGVIEPDADKATRCKRLAEIITGPRDGRLTRTIANRFWQKFMGRGLVEPVDEMEKSAWDTDLLDYLAADLVEHHYDLKQLIEQILTSRAYQMPAVSLDEKESHDYVFTGPLVRRMSAEEFRDALGELAGVWYDQPAAQIDYTIGRADVPLPSTPFPARWIWDATNAAAAAKPGTLFFRKSIRLEKLPALALAIIGADNEFTFYINGKRVGAGKDKSRLNVFDIRGQLLKGRNIFAASVTNSGDGPNPAGFFMYAVMRDGEKRGAAVMDNGTDALWLFSTNQAKGWETVSFSDADWRQASELGKVSMAPWRLAPRFKSALAGVENFGKVRSALSNADALQVALGRPNREQTVTTRFSAATTLQALELTNGRELADLIHRGAQNVLSENRSSHKELVPRLYVRALGRKPTAAELQLANDLIGQPAQPAGVEDLLWALTMLPEFQLIR